MTHTLPIAACLAITLLPHLAQAQSLSFHTAESSYQLAQNRDAIDVIADLELQGYQIETVGRTLLGRTRVVARNSFHTREVVLSTSTGEILSDTLVDVTSDRPTPKIEFNGTVTFGFSRGPDAD